MANNKTAIKIRYISYHLYKSINAPMQFIAFPFEYSSTVITKLSLQHIDVVDNIIHDSINNEMVQQINHQILDEIVSILSPYENILYEYMLDIALSPHDGLFLGIKNKK